MKQIVAELVQTALAGLPELAEAAADLAIESTVERSIGGPLFPLSGERG